MRGMRSRSSNDHPKHEVERQRGHQEADDAKGEGERVAGDRQNVTFRKNPGLALGLRTTREALIQQPETAAFSTALRGSL
jgi:hypothetical protein